MSQTVAGFLKKWEGLKDLLLSDKIINVDFRMNFQLALMCRTFIDFIFCDITALF